MEHRLGDWCVGYRHYQVLSIGCYPHPDANSHAKCDTHPNRDANSHAQCDANPNPNSDVHAKGYSHTQVSSDSRAAAATDSIGLAGIVRVVDEYFPHARNPRFTHSFVSFPASLCSCYLAQCSCPNRINEQTQGSEYETDNRIDLFGLILRGSGPGGI